MSYLSSVTRDFSLWRTDSLVVRYRFSCSVMCGILVTRPGIKSRSPTLQGRFLVLFYFIFIFNWSIIALHCCNGFCHTTTWISRRYTYVHSLLNFLPTATPSHPSWFSQSSRSHPLCSTANPHWLYLLHMVTQMFHSYSLGSSHPLLPLLCPRVCSVCLCLHSCCADMFISTVFLDSIYRC